MSIHTSDFDLDALGTMPTMKRQVLSNGMITSASDEHALFVYTKVPLVPVADARDTKQLLRAYSPLYDTLNEVASLTPKSAIKRRSAAKNSYRRIHLLRISVPKLWRADVDAPREHRLGQQRLNTYLNSALHGEVTRESILTLGIELQGSMTAGGLKHWLDSFTYTLMEGGTPLSDYDHDLQRLKRIFARTGLSDLTPGEIAAVDSWWNPGSNPDIPYLAHPQHIHMIRDSRTVRAIAHQEELGVECQEWPKDLRQGSDRRSGQSIVSIGSVADIELEYVNPADPRANWIAPLIYSDALAVSIRGSLEPTQITRNELRANRRNYLNDQAEQQQHGRMSRGEQDEKIATLEQVEAIYAAGGGSPTLVEASVLVAMDGRVDDFSHFNTAAEIRPMEHRQEQAWAEMMIASTVKSNPNVLDMPIQNIAASGIQDASKSGDRHGILRGFSERDRSPVYTNPQEAYNEADAAPISLVAGSSGSGKTMLMQWEAFQADKLGYPQVIIDPKRDSDLRPVVDRMDNGRVFTLDRLAEENGIFDPLKYAPTPEVGVEMAVSILSELNPYGSESNMAAAEPQLQFALRHGVEHGHSSTLTALRRAVEDDVIDAQLVERIEMLSMSSPMFQALVGSDDRTEGLRVHDGTTLIMAGQQELSLPPMGATPKGINQRIAVALVRSIVQGSSMALTGRNGIIRLDEAWVFLSSNPQELGKLGRLARSQGTDVNLYTQRVSDILDAGMRDYVTRGVILHLANPEEAKAACELFDLEPTPERMARILSRGTLDDELGSPDWNSLKALRDPETGRVQRGSVGIDVDIHGRAVPVEIRIPPLFLQWASTRDSDVAARLASQGS